MLKYIAKRLFQMFPTVVGVVLVTFLLFNVVGGDLAATALGKNVSLQMMEDFDAQRGLDKPLFFGYRAGTRAFEDLDASVGRGRWQAWSNATHSAETGTVAIGPQTEILLPAFALDPGRDYEWTVVYRGKAILAGEALDSGRWSRAKIRFGGGRDVFLQTGEEPFELRRLSLRKVVANPFDSQLSFYVRQLLRGDLGTSEYFKQPVARLLADGIVPSLKLTVPIFFIGIVVSVSLSLVCAFFRDTWLDRFFVVVSVALMSINYLVYIVAGQYLLSYKLGWFPVWGYESWRFLVLPVAIGVVSGLGANLRFYRTIMLDEMYKDYVRTAFAKGVSKPRVLFVHVLKNAMIPIITNVVIAIPFLYTGSLLLESFFGVPGLGYLGINAILSSDIDVVRALVLIGALLFVVANLLTDLCYAAADPRVKLG